MFVTLNYHILATFHIISKINFRNFAKLWLLTFAAGGAKVPTQEKKKDFCEENFNLKLVFNSFKIKNYFSYEDPVPNELKPLLAYKFTYASYSSNYIGETCCHFKSKIEEHMKKDNKSHIFKHLHSTTTCFDLYNSLCLK